MHAPRSSPTADLLLVGAALLRALAESSGSARRPLARTAAEAMAREQQRREAAASASASALVQPLPLKLDRVQATASTSAAVPGEQQLDGTRASTAPRVSAVPSSRVARLWEYGTLAAGLGMGAAGEALGRLAGGSGTSAAQGNLLFNDNNVQRLVRTLSRMRGAALKLGQMLSIQDNVFGETPVVQDGKSKSNNSPHPLAHLSEALTRLQNQADAMPQRQLERVLREELGVDWRSKFVTFEDRPFAAASIGQVHRATVKRDGIAGDEKGAGATTTVAVKIQYPGVARSIESDLDNLALLTGMTGLLPKGLYLDNTVRVAKRELAREVDYEAEAQATTRFRELVADTPFFEVPRVVDGVSTKRVLVTEFVNGVPMGRAAVYDQYTRNKIAERLLHLCLREVFVFRFMQTDPNWSNFLYDHARDKICLLDFGAAREFEKSFTDKYMQLLMSAADNDTSGCIRWSRELGFLTGNESAAMEKAHVGALMALAAPFNQPGIFDFGKQTTSQEVRDQIPVMLRERLTPPPEETYSLHRKLSGAFLLCTKLRAQVPCRDIFRRYRDGYRFDVEK